MWTGLAVFIVLAAIAVGGSITLDRVDQRRTDRELLNFHRQKRRKQE